MANYLGDINEKRNDELFHKLVPSVGSADTTAGEMLRAVNRIAYRFENNGDRIGIASGKEYCNPAARYLAREGNALIRANAEWLLNHPYETNDEEYKAMIDTLVRNVIDFIDSNPGLTECNLSLMKCNFQLCALPADYDWDGEDEEEDE